MEEARKGLRMYLDGDMVWNQEFCIGHIMLRCLVHVQVEVLWRQVIYKSGTQRTGLKLKYKCESHQHIDGI